MNALLLEALTLKHIDREGWKRIGIAQPESVASHSWGMCLLILLLTPDDIDKTRALELAILHDLAEARVGDITPHDGVSKEAKRSMETEAISAMLADHPDLQKLWLEYDAGVTREARFVHDIDRLDMALQAAYYSKKLGVNTREFLDSARRTIHHHGVEALITQLVDE